MSASKDAKKNYDAVIKTNESNQQIAREANEWNAMMQQKQNEYNTQMYNQQVADTWEMWNAQNEYNSPSAQRERLEAAGLNPYLMMDGGNAGSASSMSAPSANSLEAPSAVTIPNQAPQMQNRGMMAMGILSGIADVLKKTQDANQVYIENQYRAQDMRETIKGKGLQNDFQRAENSFARQFFQGRNVLQATQNDLLRQQTYGQILGNIYQSGQNKFQSVEQATSVASAIANIRVANTQGDLNVQGLREGLARIDNILQSTRESAARTALLDEQTEAQRLQNEGQNATNAAFYKEQRKYIGEMIKNELNKGMVDGVPSNPFQAVGAGIESLTRVLDSWISGW